MTAIHTQRLVLRRWRDADLAPFAAMNADPEVMQFFPAPLSRPESDALADRADGRIERDGHGLWAVEVPGQFDFIGFVGLAPQDVGESWCPAVEVGWRLRREAWGRGYASEAAREALRVGFEDAGLDRIMSMTARINTPSQAVMRRIGMTHDPTHDFAFDHPHMPEGHPLRPHVVYWLTAETWRATRGTAQPSGGTG